MAQHLLEQFNDCGRQPVHASRVLKGFANEHAHGAPAVLGVRLYPSAQAVTKPQPNCRIVSPVFGLMPQAPQAIYQRAS
jgi:hypothetical protein